METGTQLNAIKLSPRMAILADFRGILSVRLLPKALLRFAALVGLFGELLVSLSHRTSGYIHKSLNVKGLRLILTAFGTQLFLEQLRGQETGTQLVLEQLRRRLQRKQRGFSIISVISVCSC